MKYYIILLNDGSFKIFKNRQDTQNARQFVCSSNVTVQDLSGWATNDYKGFGTIEEVE